MTDSTNNNETQTASGNAPRRRAAPVPSLADIRARAAIERQAWDEETRERRCVGASRKPYTIPIVKTPAFFERSDNGGAE